MGNNHPKGPGGSHGAGHSSEQQHGHHGHGHSSSAWSHGRNRNSRTSRSGRTSSPGSPSPNTPARQGTPTPSPTPALPPIDEKYLQPQGMLYSSTGVSKAVLAAAITSRKLACCKPGSGQEDAGSEECPICFLWYDLGLNRSGCCRKGICTECFLQMNVKEVSGGLIGQLCPFCNHTPFSVVFEGAISADLLREQSLEQQRISESAERHQQVTLRKQEEAQRARREEVAAQRREKLLRRARRSVSCCHLEYPGDGMAVSPEWGGGDTGGGVVCIESEKPSMPCVVHCMSQWHCAFERFEQSQRDAAGGGGDTGEGEAVGVGCGGSGAVPAPVETHAGAATEGALEAVWGLAGVMPPLPALEDLLKKTRRQREKQFRGSGMH